MITLHETRTEEGHPSRKINIKRITKEQIAVRVMKKIHYLIKQLTNEYCSIYLLVSQTLILHPWLVWWVKISISHGIEIEIENNPRTDIPALPAIKKLITYHC